MWQRERIRRGIHGQQLCLERALSRARGDDRAKRLGRQVGHQLGVAKRQIVAHVAVKGGRKAQKTLKVERGDGAAADRGRA